MEFSVGVNVVVWGMKHVCCTIYIITVNNRNFCRATYTFNRSQAKLAPEYKA